MNNPSEIAREALRQLAMQRTPPTPDNYRQLYFKISGVKDTSAAGAKLAWAGLIQQLVERWDSRQAGLTPTQKKSTLERVLSAHLDNDRLFERLQVLVNQWGERAPAPEQQSLVDDAATPLAEPAPSPQAPVELIREACADIVDRVLASTLNDTPKLAEDARALATKLRGLSVANAEEILAGLRRLALRMEFHTEDQLEIRGGLLHLLQLVVDNIGELVIDDHWLTGQMEVLRGIISGPLNVRAIDNAERRLKEVLFKQSQLKHGLAEAQSTIKHLLTDFVDKLASFAESTGTYHDKLDGYTKKISEAKDITQLENVIGEVMSDTRSIQGTALKMRDDLTEARAKARSAENRIAQLERELSATSEMVRHDQLTGALNRRGLEEVFEKEIARAKRQESPLCLAVLDIDNFKKLNDSLGHQAGDSALTHLVATVRNAVRPQDTVARYGGEEFVVLLPDTQLEEGRQAMVRVQRELTKHYFMHDNQKVLITFSCGVTQLPPDGTREDAIKRADELMYQAKNTGKNKVVAA